MLNAKLFHWEFLMFIVILLNGYPETPLSLNNCPAQVFYGDGGSNIGNCQNPDQGLCATRIYALEQGLNICQSEVQIFWNKRLTETYRDPTSITHTPFDWLVTIGYWMMPFLIGGGAAWWLAFRYLVQRT